MLRLPHFLDNRLKDGGEVILYATDWKCARSCSDNAVHLYLEITCFKSQSGYHMSQMKFSVVFVSLTR
jgi:hypothetical protein